MGFAAIALGSMGAHGPVHDLVKAAGHLDHWETAVRYHLPHSILLVMLSFHGAAGGKLAAWAWRCLFVGVLLFCGSLYLLAYTQTPWLAHIAPFGGLSLMVGWLLLAFARWQVRA